VDILKLMKYTVLLFKKKCRREVPGGIPLRRWGFGRIVFYVEFGRSVNTSVSKIV